MRALDQRPADAAVRPELPPFIAARFHPRGLLARILFLTLLFSAELVVISTLLDSDSLARDSGLTGPIRDWGPWVLRAIVGLTAIFATFVWLKHRASLEQISSQLEQAPVVWAWLVPHGLAMAAFATLSGKLYGGSLANSLTGALTGTPKNVLAVSWLGSGIAAILFAALAGLPWKQWARLIATGGKLWAYASIAILVACVAGNFSRSLWEPTSHFTFTLVKWMLKPVLGGLIADPALLRLGTSGFRVIIAPECSGLEGAGLILAFGTVWLLLFRREIRFPQSLVLIPASVAVLFLLNAVRIAALILIGNAGARQIALGGFHSQAGWILFNAVAVAFCLTIQHVPWFNKHPRSHVVHEIASDNPTAAYLLPFLAILAAGMIATATAAGFEWLYSLRLVAAAAALWVYRKHYAALEWRPSWFAAAAGAVVFAVWIGLDRLWGTGQEHGVPAALVAASPALRAAWIAFRATAAIATVPLAEELAFRGFLLRRLTSADFEAVPFQRTTWFALLASSVVFGLLHGGQWSAGVIAGIMLGLLVKRRGNMGDAVVAHATANALLAAYVLMYGQWHLW